MPILGIHNGHNGTASLIKNGKVIACASEERFNGVKNFYGFPKKAIDYVLKTGCISSSDLDYVAMPFLYGTPAYASSDVKKNLTVNFFIFLYKPVSFVRIVWGELNYFFPILRPIGKLIYRILAELVGKYTMKKEKAFVAKHLNIKKEKIMCFDHHLSHAASAYYASSFNNKKSLVLTLDGEGDNFSGSVNIFNGTKIKTLARIPREDSLGYVYHDLTEFLGMKGNEHEYKVMGLAPYAKLEYVNKLWKKVDNIVEIDPKRLVFNFKFNTTDTKKYLRRNLSNLRFDILAGLFQKLVEEKTISWVKACVKQTGITTVVLSGGVFMNVKLNQKIASLKEISEIFILPSCGDESAILGASYLAYRKHCIAHGKKFSVSPIQNIYWGPAFSDIDIEKALNNKRYRGNFKISKSKNIHAKIAKVLSGGQVVARVNGRMEFGARALGNRSILADPRNSEIVKVINESVKNRDFWMPFAPSILKEREKDYIINPRNLDAPYMMMTFDTTKKGQKDLKAAMHPYDFTARPQIVSKDYNPDYYKVLKEFEKLTGIGAVLNTSFNLHGYPIVLGPKEALEAFENSGLNYLALGNYLIAKKN